MNFYRKMLFFRAVYEGDEGGNNQNPPQPPTPEEKKFSQDELNKFLAEDRRKHQQKLETTIAELEKLKESKQLTEEEKNGLTARIEELQSNLINKDEEAKRTLDKKEKEFKKQLEQLELSNKKNWALYEQEVIKNTITQAAIDHKAVSPDQLMAILKPQTRLVEVMDNDGKPTGSYVPKIKFLEEKEDGKAVELDLEVKDYVKRMRDTPERFGNLFLSEAQQGLGSFNRGNSSGGNSVPPTDPAAYRKWRKHNLT